MKKVSLIVPTYNGEIYINAFLNSLFNQKKQPDEVIFQDDKSSDDTVRIIKQFIFVNNISNWTLYVNNENIGWRKNFQSLLSKVSGDIIFIADQDDIWYQNKIKQMVGYFENNSDIKVLSSDYDVDSRLGNAVDFGSLLLEGNENDTVRRVIFSKDNFAIKRPGWTFAIEKSILPYYEGAQKYSPNKSYDAIIWQIGLLSGSLYHLSERTGKWIMHQDSAMSKETKQVKKKKKEILQKYFLDEYKFANFNLNYILLEKKVHNLQEYGYISKREKEFLQRYKSISTGSLLSVLRGFYHYRNLKDFIVDLKFVNKL